MLTLEQSVVFAHDLVSHAATPARGPVDPAQAVAADGRGTAAVLLVITAVLLLFALRNFRRAVGPVIEIVRAVVSAGLAVLFVVSALVLVVISVFVR